MRILYKHTGTVFEHRVKATKALGRPLVDPEEVHHVDGNPNNNENSNLVICPDSAYHTLLHIRTRALEAFGSPDARVCVRCKNYDVLDNLVVHSRRKVNHQYVHRECRKTAYNSWYSKGATHA